MSTTAEYGAWRSVIDAERVTRCNCKAICELQIANDSVFWIEQQFPDGRRALFESKLGGDPVEWTKPSTNVRNCVHEYGGGSLVATGSAVYFTTLDGVYMQTSAASDAKLITSGSKANRFADLCVHNGDVFAVHEEHFENERFPKNSIARIRADGVTETAVSGADFYMAPRVSPDGRFFSWMEWNFPFMPWDESSVVVAKVTSNGSIGETVCRLSHTDVNFHGAEWNSDSELFVISDVSNWWNLYSVILTESKLGGNIYPVNEEIGVPLWQFTDRQYAINKYGILLNVSGKLFFKSTDGSVERVTTEGYTQFKCLQLTDNNIAYCIAAGPKRSSSVLQIDLRDKKVKVLRESRDSSEIDALDISIPRLLKFCSGEIDVTGWFYPPHSSKYAPPPGTLPPVVLLAHGGPTAYAANTLDMRVQFFTTRGFAVFDVNYRGSTGFGTRFRNLLRGEWGVVDRDDTINAAEFLVHQGLVDRRRICIMGSSAGGYLLLSALQHSKVFSAAACLYGVCDLIGLTQETHKFEAGYNEQLIGKYPKGEEVYKSRSPISFPERINCPVAFFHGDEDKVVPLAQSIALYEAVRDKGLPTSLTVFKGEGHGFRGAHAVNDTLNGAFFFFCTVLGIETDVKSQIKIVNLDEKAVKTP